MYIYYTYHELLRYRFILGLHVLIHTLKHFKVQLILKSTSN